MTDFESEIRDQYRPALERPAPARRPDCPAPEVLLAALRGEGAEADRLTVLDHALACPACRPDLALLHASSGLAVSKPATRPAVWWRLVPMAAAAVTLLMVGIGGYNVWKWGQQVEATRGDGGLLVTPSPNGELGLERRFVWHRQPGAIRYRLEVTGQDGTVLFATTTSDTAVALAAGTVPPGEHRWWVRAEFDDGSERRSEARAVRVSGRPQ